MALALYTFGQFLKPAEDAANDGFHALNDPVMASVDAAPGLIARSGYASDAGPAPWGAEVYPRFYRDRGDGWSPATLSLWADLGSVAAFTYSGLHAIALRQGRAWFEKPHWPPLVLWWHPDPLPFVGLKLLILLVTGKSTPPPIPPVRWWCPQISPYQANASAVCVTRFLHNQNRRRKRAVANPKVQVRENRRGRGPEFRLAYLMTRRTKLGPCHTSHALWRRVSRPGMRSDILPIFLSRVLSVVALLRAKTVLL